MEGPGNCKVISYSAKWITSALRQSGRSAVWQARLPWEQEVVSSNLTVPTKYVGKFNWLNAWTPNPRDAGSNPVRHAKNGEVAESGLRQSLAKRSGLRASLVQIQLSPPEI